MVQRTNRVLAAVLASCLVSLVPVCCPADLQRDPEPLLVFADGLFSEMEYYRAITEYRRFLSYYPQDSRTGGVHFRIFECYFLGERYAEALAWARRIRESSASSPEDIGTAELCIGEALLKLQNPASARQHFQAAVGARSPGEVVGRANYGVGLSYVREGDLGDAAAAFAAVPRGSAFFDRAQAASRKAENGGRLPHKRPLAAGLLNVVPGLGYAYVGMPQTGLAAFVVNGLFGAAAYSAFRKGETGVGVLTGVLAFGWYTGGMYGAAVGANRYNRRITQDYWSEF